MSWPTRCSTRPTSSRCPDALAGFRVDKLELVAGLRTPRPATQPDTGPAGLSTSRRRCADGVRIPITEGACDGGKRRRRDGDGATERIGDGRPKTPVSTIFGEPVQRERVTAIPVARHASASVEVSGPALGSATRALAAVEAAVLTSARSATSRCGTAAPSSNAFRPGSMCSPSRLRRRSSRLHSGG